MFRLVTLLFILLSVSHSGYAQDSAPDQVNDTPSLTFATAEDQEHCITVLSGFPDANHQERYQFFRLVQLMGEDATPQFREAVSAFGDGTVAANTPITDVIEVISNPVLRQAAPEVAISHMGHLIEFSQICRAFLAGQINSLSAYDTGLAEVSFNQVIAEDALFLRQVLADALYRSGADSDPQHSETIITYARSLVWARNDIEFAGFNSEVDEIEAIFLSDLDGRLARSNDIINNEMSAESIAAAISLSRDLNRSAADKARQERQRDLLRIFRIFQ